MNCKPKSFHGMKGVVSLTQLIEKTESIFQISFCPNECKTLTMKGSKINAYTARFNDLAVMCPALVTPEYKKIERYIWGLALQIKGMVIASKPTTYDSAKHIAHQLTSIEIQVGFIAESPESGTNKRKFSGKNPIQSFEERHEVATNYSATKTIPPQPRKYAGKLPMCTQCNRHHIGNCSWCSQLIRQHAGDCYICMKCKKKGHTASYCRSTTPTTENQGTNIGIGYDGGRACFECGEIGHIKKECPKLSGQ
uniref:CCHC-type domain-containing protein n=1 Tax=Lactuca sativa TaxID=4236 RepID=A0A9R1UC89_LACSA|nr:hypothetical protein LSAT_V11C900489900 [Lactuca sativa]